MSYSLCGSVGANTGSIACDVRRGRPVGMLIGAAVFAPSDYSSTATFQTAFRARIQRATGVSDKLYPMPEFQGNTDQTAADKTGTLGYGLTQVLLQGKPGYLFNLIAGSTQEKALRKFNNKTVPVFIFDDGGNIWGKVDNAGNFSGTDVLISVKGKGFDDANNPKTTEITIGFINAGDFYDNAAFASTNFGIGDLQGLVDVIGAEVSAHTTNVFHVKLYVPTAQLGVTLNPYDQFADALAVASNWTSTGAGAALPITSIAKVPGTQSWDITTDNPTFTALAAAAVVTFKLVDPATLATNGVTGTEMPVALVTAK
jgi:hypothetical protein